MNMIIFLYRTVFIIQLPKNYRVVLITFINPKKTIWRAVRKDYNMIYSI